MNNLTESGVYKLVFKSRKPSAEKFSDWVTDEVLPTLREKGSYSLKPQENQSCTPTQKLYKGQPVAILAVFCGYESELHFMRQFKKYTGLTPSGYREESRRQKG